MYHNSCELQDPIGMVQVEEQGKPAGRASLLKSATKFICAVPNTCYYWSKAIDLLTLHFFAK